MISYAPALKEHHFERPTTRNPFYDMQGDATQHIFLDGEPEAVHKNFRIPLTYTYQKLARMLSWQEDWDSEGSAKPNVYSILKAKRWIGQMRADATDTGKGWEEPHTAPDENGDIAFEWWCGDRNLVVYVSPDTVYYLQAWGPDIESQMMDGEIKSAEDNKKSWLWLMG